MAIKKRWKTVGVLAALGLLGVARAYAQTVVLL